MSKIFLVMVDPKTEEETHMEWEGHTSLEDAKTEYQTLRALSMKEGIKPIDGYVYEAEAPPYGIKPTKLDMAKFASFFENTVLGNSNYDYEIVQ
jgi:hypothetical protein